MNERTPRLLGTSLQECLNRITSMFLENQDGLGNFWALHEFNGNELNNVYIVLVM